MTLALATWLSFTAGCTQQVDTGQPPVVIALADAVSPSRPESSATTGAPATEQPPQRDPPRAVPFDPAALLDESRLHDECVAPLLPSAAENRWLEIPWRSDLLRARREANAEGKPIFMWLMDGNPLGCT